MRARVKEGVSNLSDMLIDVRSIDYKYVSGYISGAESHERVRIPFDDVEFIFDNDWEKKIIKYRDILRITLPKGVSPRFFAAVVNAIEEYHKGEISSICILRDTEEKVRKKYWYKSLIVVINNTCPILLTATGREYSNTYDISIVETDTESLIFECREEICKLRKIIKIGSDKLKFYEGTLHALENPDSIRYKAIEGDKP